MGLIPLTFSALFGATIGGSTAFAFGFGPLGVFVATEAAATLGCLTMALIIALHDLRAVADRSRDTVLRAEAGRAFLQPGE